MNAHTIYHMCVGLLIQPATLQTGSCFGYGSHTGRRDIWHGCQLDKAQNKREKRRVNQPWRKMQAHQHLRKGSHDKGQER